MIKAGKIEGIFVSPSGLESVIKIKFNEQIGSIFCYILLAKNYEPGDRPRMVKADVDSYNEPVLLKVGEVRDFNISVIFANKYDAILDDEPLGYEQPINESPHVKIKAVVNKIIDEYAMLCNINGLGEDILVNCETCINRIGIGDRVHFNGEIKVEPFVHSD